MLTLAGNFVEKFGYGNYTVALARGLIERGYDVRIHPMLTDEVPKDLISYMTVAPKYADVVIWGPRDAMIPGRFLFTMWESDEIPDNSFKDYEQLIVPCRFVRDTVRKYTDKPVHICPLGADGTYVPPRFDTFTFTAIGTDHGIRTRKRTEDTLRAFIKAFPTEPDVRLVLKQSSRCYAFPNFDTRVHIIRADLSRGEMNKMIADTTVGVAIGGMEGWGLPANEFIAHGKPVISPLAQGHADILDMSCAFALDFSLVKAPTEKPYHGVGLRPWVSVDDVAEQMRFAYYNRYEVMRRSVAAYHKAQKLTVDNMVETFIKIIYGRSKRSGARNQSRGVRVLASRA